MRWLAATTVAAAVAIYLAIAFGGIGENLVYYWGPTQVQAAGGKAVHAAIRLGGMVAAGSIVRGHGPSELEFDVVDAGARIHVKSHGVPPQLFREGIGVVVEGTMTRAGVLRRRPPAGLAQQRVPGAHRPRPRRRRAADPLDVGPRARRGKEPR